MRIEFRRGAKFWTGAGVVERARLESECASNGTEGSNPSLSASLIIRELQQGKGASYNSNYNMVVDVMEVI